MLHYCNSFSHLSKHKQTFDQYFKQIRPFSHYRNLAKSGDKTRGVKKVSKYDENYVEKLKKQPNFYAKECEVRSIFFTNKPMILLVYNEVFFNTNNPDHVVPSVVSLLQEFTDMFHEDIPSELPSLRGIKHQIDFVLWAAIPIRSAYKSNLEEMKELQRKVDELMKKRGVHS
jgi:hypothetical protein